MHSNVDPATVAENVNEGAVLFDSAGGPLVIDVSSAAAIVNVRVAGVASALPMESVARIENVYVPSALVA